MFPFSSGCKKGLESGANEAVYVCVFEGLVKRKLAHCVSV